MEDYGNREDCGRLEYCGTSTCESARLCNTNSAVWTVV